MSTLPVLPVEVAISKLEELVLFIWDMETRNCDAQYLAGKVDGFLDAIYMLTGDTKQEIINRLREKVAQ